MQTSATGTPDAGFTLIEVLVALFVIGVALSAGMRALGVVTATSRALPPRVAAQWSATNALDELRLEHAWPDLGPRDFDCSQGRFTLRCHEQVNSTPNPQFRWVEVTVTGTDTPAILARLDTVLPQWNGQAL